MNPITRTEVKIQPFKVNQDNENDFHKLYEEAQEDCAVL